MQQCCRQVIPISQVKAEQPQQAGIQLPIIVDAQWGKITVNDNGNELVKQGIKVGGVFHLTC